MWTKGITNGQEIENKFIFEIGRDIIKMAMQKYLWNENKTVNFESNVNFFLSFLQVHLQPGSKLEKVKLIDLVNLTDFIDISRIIGLNEQDQVMNSLQKIQAEKSIVQDLFNHNFSFQKPMPTCGLLTPT